MTAVAGEVAAALAAGQATLLEPQAYRVAALLGIGAPAHSVVPPGGPLPSLDGLRGERLVVKVLSPAVPHKSDRGGVRLVRRGSVAKAIAEMARAFEGVEVRGWLVAEEVPHPPGSEVLFGLRRTAEFGLVAVLGLGGVEAEILAAAVPPAVFLPEDGPADGVPAVGGLTGGRRGVAPAVAAESLDEFLRRLEGKAGALPPEVAEIEFNPLVFTAAGPVALDAAARLAAAPEVPLRRPAAGIERLLRPGSVAIMGVSERLNPGRVILRNVLAAGFPAERVTVVKAGRAAIDGCRCVPDLEALPAPVDLLVLSLAAGAVPEVVEEICRRGAAASVIVIPGGLGERSGSESLAARTREAIGAARRRGGGPVVNGGNSMGVRSAPGRYDATFIPPHKSSPSAGAAVAPLAVISQSGAFAIARLDRLVALQPRYLITVGNQIDLTVGDYLQFLAEDPGVEVAACYVEGFRPGDGAAFLEATRRLRDRAGAVVAYFAGRNAAGAAAAASHTASIAPDHALARALTERAGGLVADTLERFEDLVRLAVLLSHRSVGAGRRLGAVSNAGFEAVAVADNASPLSLAALGRDTAARVEQVLEAHRLEGIVGVSNPLDLTPIAGDAGFAEAAAAVLADAAVDVGIVGVVPLTPSLTTLPAGAGHGEEVGAAGGLAARLIDLWRSTTKAWVTVIDGGALYDALARRLEEAGMPVFRTADRATRALSRYCRWRVSGGRAPSGPGEPEAAGAGAASGSSGGGP